MSIDLPENGSTDEGTGDRWRGYSDYKSVSIRVSESIDQALDAYARIEGSHAENAPIQPELAAEARARIRAATMKLIPEMEQDRDSVDTYDEILSKWQGEEGYIARLSRTQLKQTCPAWLHDMVIDIRTAGWELGYLQAGKRERGEVEDPVEEEVTSMMEE